MALIAQLWNHNFMFIIRQVVDNLNAWETGSNSVLLLLFDLFDVEGPLEGGYV